MNRLTNFPYNKVLILGLAKSGTAAAQILLNNEIDVVVNDLSAKKTNESVSTLIKQGAEVVLGSHPLDVLEDVDVVIKNPGIPYDNVLIEEAKRQNIPVFTEVELVPYLFNGLTIGITGSNGKTTTTTLINEMLLKSQVDSKVAGNIGEVASEVAQSMEPNETMVIELSSFQLLGVENFTPRVALLLNLFEAHLDYHLDMENYINAKKQVFQNQTSEDFFVYNADDPIVNKISKESKAKLIPFSKTKACNNGAWIKNEAIYFRDERVIDLVDVALVGEHNLENVLAAISVAKLSGATNQGIYEVLTTFMGVEHRLQHVATFEDRLFYNDSKATNILATEKALSSFDQSIILLAGGLDRGNEFDSLIPYLTNVKAMILFGETANKLSRIGEEFGVSNIQHVKDMEDAVIQAFEVSDEKDVILLSPACASWDQYKTFEERGEKFIDAVNKLIKKKV